MESAEEKENLTLLLGTAVQILFLTICDDPERTAFDLCNFLETIHTPSNDQAVQKLRVQLDNLECTEGADSDKHLNKFNRLIAQLAMYNVSIDKRQK